MSKPKIYATGNETIKGGYNVSYYIFEEDNSFLEWFGELLEEVLDIGEGKQKAKFNTQTIEGEGEELEKFSEKEINKMIDVHEKYENKGERADVFYGKEKVYVTLRKSKEIRAKFAKFVEKNKNWVEVKKSPEFSIKVGNKSN